MSDAGQESPTKGKKRFRSPPYPMYDLGKAIERIGLVYNEAKHHAVQAPVLAEAWGMKSVDGKVWRSAAALIQYGLLSDSGTGKSRKFQLTDTAKRLVLDTDPASEKRKDALRNAALSPMIHKELWDKFGTANDIGDNVIRTYLTIDREEDGEAPYSPSAADEVLGTYRSTLTYAGISDSDKVDLPEEVTEDKNDDPGVLKNSVPVEVGDYVKWTSNGTDQFEAKQVTWVSDDEKFVRVFGSPTGIPMSEVEKVTAPSGAKAAVAAMNAPQAFAGGGEAKPIAKPSGGAGKLENFTGYIVDGKLQLTAEVSKDEIDKLKEILDGYKTILGLLH